MRSHLLQRSRRRPDAARRHAVGAREVRVQGDSILALGIPTVASPVGMNREVIRDSVRWLSPADDAELVVALDALLSDARPGAPDRDGRSRDRRE